jgi:hypothetical protein
MKHSAWSRLWVPVGAGLFVLALTVSAAVVPQLCLLHFLQALIYVAIVLLARRNSALGFGAGVAVAAAWNGLNLFVTHLMQAGAVEFWALLHTGHTRRVDTMMVLVGGVGHLILMIACLVAFLHPRAGKREWGKFLAGGAAALAYLGLIIAAAAPR